MVQLQSDRAKARAGREDTISTLYSGALGRLEFVQCSGQRVEPGKRASSKHFHVVLPLSGSFLWCPGGDEIFADSTKALFASGDEDFAIGHPAGGDCSLVIWPSAATMAEITGRSRRTWKQHPAFAARLRQLSCEIQLSERMLLACAGGDNLLAIEESMARLLTLLVDDGSCREVGVPHAKQTLARAKTVLHAQSSERLTLTEIATAVGVSPVYLTQLFRTAEGMPLYQYALNVRMAAALNALGDSEDITRLAIDLGFSSHSHFSATFRRRFGSSPSAVRTALRTQQGAPSVPKRLALGDANVRPLCASRGGTVDWLWS